MKILQDVKVGERDRVVFYSRGGIRKKKSRADLVTAVVPRVADLVTDVVPQVAELVAAFGHFARNCPLKQRNNKSMQPDSKIISYTSFAVSSVELDAWYIDSDASAHMCANPQLMSNVSQAARSEVVVANDMRWGIPGTENVFLPVADTKLKGCRTYKSKKVLVASSSLDGELFKLANSLEAEYNIWHRRMGHLNIAIDKLRIMWTN